MGRSGQVIELSVSELKNIVAEKYNADVDAIDCLYEVETDDYGDSEEVFAGFQFTSWEKECDW